eukprot:TRINITY_DN18686_c0_g2_i12.p1 TRINITY_DN18686_c0_g2~~TRINITY_DN18686_c0_g2_i12.p1  ORF type:complete len:373 (+),score=64.98 TRINITY_DN18686_c0_g2_i12:530-1648(+)
MITMRPSGGYVAAVRGQNNSCDVVFIATGISVPRTPRAAQGSEFIETYDSMSVDPQDYINKSVLIFGNGNSAFETAAALGDVVAYIFLVGKRRLRLASDTFYEGDVHATANNLVDSYHLKSLDAVGEHDLKNTPSIVEDGELLRIMSPGFVMQFKSRQRYRKRLEAKQEYKTGAEGRYSDAFLETHPEIGRKYLEMRAGYDDTDGSSWNIDLWGTHKLIMCYGFAFNETVFTGLLPCQRETEDCPEMAPAPGRVQIAYRHGLVNQQEPIQWQSSRTQDFADRAWPERTYPTMTDMFESALHPDLFFIGATMHSNDWSNSSGGFIHGFRHLIAGLHNALEFARHQVPWPSTQIPDVTPGAITEALVTRGSCWE